MDDSLFAEFKAFVLRRPPPKLAADAMLSAEDFRQLGYAPRMLFPVGSKSDVAGQWCQFIIDTGMSRMN